METAAKINRKLAEHYEQIAIYHRQLSQLEGSAADEGAAKSPQRETSDDEKPLWKHRYKLAPGYDGKLALLIKAMYEEKMFLKEDGSHATSVEDVAHYIGATLGEDYHDWRQTLRGAVLPDCVLSFFDKLQNKIMEYKSTIKH